MVEKGKIPSSGIRQTFKTAIISEDMLACIHVCVPIYWNDPSVLNLCNQLVLLTEQLTISSTAEADTITPLYSYLQPPAN